jgi:hypothetical protein
MNSCQEKDSRPRKGKEKYKAASIALGKRKSVSLCIKVLYTLSNSLPLRDNHKK